MYVQYILKCHRRLLLSHRGIYSTRNFTTMIWRKNGPKNRQRTLSYNHKRPKLALDVLRPGIFLTSLGSTGGEFAPQRLSFGYFPCVLTFFLNIHLQFSKLRCYLIANFQFFIQNLPILKLFVHKNGIKSLSPSEKFSF